MKIAVGLLAIMACVLAAVLWSVGVREQAVADGAERLRTPAGWTEHFHDEVGGPSWLCFGQQPCPSVARGWTVSDAPASEIESLFVDVDGLDVARLDAASFVTCSRFPCTREVSVDDGLTYRLSRTEGSITVRVY